MVGYFEDNCSGGKKDKYYDFIGSKIGLRMGWIFS